MKGFQRAVRLGVILVLFAATPAAADSDEDDSSFGPWSAPTSLGTTINSAFFDSGPGLTPDGKSLYFSSNRPGGSGGPSDLWVSQRANKNGEWGAPVNLGPVVNSAGADAVPSFSRDGHWMFFTSDRAGGLGSNDIWVSFRSNPNDDFAWQTPVNLGAPINSAFFDAGPALVEKGNEDILYFNSDRLGTPDIYTSVRTRGGSFGTPMLVTELNTAFSDQRVAIRKDHLELFLFSNRTGSAGLDIWTSTRASRDAVWGAPTNVAAINSTATDFQPALSRDSLTLIFASDRAGGLGLTDLYVTTRTRSGG